MSDHPDAPLLRRAAELLEAMIDPEPCRFDHHGGCQEHGFLSLEAGEKCPNSEAKEVLDALASSPSAATAQEPSTLQLQEVATLLTDRLHGYWIPAEHPRSPGELRGDQANLREAVRIVALWLREITDHRGPSPR